MAAANTDKFKYLSRRWVGQIGSGGVADGTVTTIPLASTTNLPTGTAVVVVIDRVDSNGTATPTLEETAIAVVSGSNLVSAVRGSEGTAQAHNAGGVVEVLVTAIGWNDIVDGILVGHTQLGNHRALKDVNGNTWIDQTAVTNAVNSVIIGNAITASNPTTCATGTDSNVGWDIRMKGTGKMRKPTIVGIQAVGATTDTSTGDSKAFFRVPAELSGMNLTGVAMSVATAGTTNTTDTQLRRVRAGASADMLSTKLTIDSTEVDTSTAAAAAVIDATKDDVVTGDQVHVDLDAVSTTAAKGLYVELRFELP